MNPYTGEYVQLDAALPEAEARRRAAEQLACSEADLLELRGSVDAVEALAARAQLGAAERARRDARRKAQRQSRRANRPR